MAQPSHPGRLHCIRELAPLQSSQSQPTLCVPSHPPHPQRCARELQSSHPQFAECTPAQLRQLQSAVCVVAQAIAVTELEKGVATLALVLEVLSAHREAGRDGAKALADVTTRVEKATRPAESDCPMVAAA
uniref:Uncharacterized protein n=1 Tax=Florenciella parvula TaxID=236787 RepID=A0A7S2G7M4_9STRA|mmetsp:Transcript_5472/g.11175  ORF Transcript_5472/g.11175 Transcript_5472/m.11175 type:complete len:131 (+) Transcript_5472:474-866(+)|eukprot:CAMPEP_0182535080 /NCGR_PEP_ID=MMETSP1323-20130603/17016_1 /TAXON_ID=236787 /ORGANISM="Florenciella parvula, Strain RCC1693" /LENGTH=130 /DNA_ID=CAMNT_0024745163 /DNA_START=464 /DNA_END=856 /DNA_ORIENTATION=-